MGGEARWGLPFVVHKDHGKGKKGLRRARGGGAWSPLKEGGGVQERGSKVRTVHETKVRVFFTQRTEKNSGLHSRRTLRGIKGAWVGPRGVVPLVRSTVMADVQQM